jgi:hypothetical protein
MTSGSAGRSGLVFGSAYVRHRHPGKDREHPASAETSWPRVNHHHSALCSSGPEKVAELVNERNAAKAEEIERHSLRHSGDSIQ